jgi:hypothetical protein
MSRKSLVFFKRIINEPQEAPGNNSGIMMPCCFLSLAALFYSKG